MACSCQGKVDSLQRSMDQILEILKKQDSKRDDDSLLLHTLSGKLEVQGERLRRLEDHMTKQHVGQGQSQGETEVEVTPVTPVTSEPVIQLIKRELDGLADVQIKLHRDVTGRLDKVTSSNTEDCKAIFSTLTSWNDEVTKKLDVMETAQKDLSDRVRRMFKVTTFSNIKTKQELAMCKKSAKTLSAAIKKRLKQQNHTLAAASNNQVVASAAAVSCDKKLDSALAMMNHAGVDLQQVKDSLLGSSDKGEGGGGMLGRLLCAQTKHMEDSLATHSSTVSQTLAAHNKRIEESLEAHTSHVSDSLTKEYVATRKMLMTSTQTSSVYKYDFHIKEFYKWVAKGGGASKESDVWHIGLDKPHLVARVFFNTQKTLDVSLASSRCPRATCGGGLRPRVRVEVSCVCQVGRGNDWVIGVCEGELNGEAGWAWLGDVTSRPISCQDFRTRGLVNRESVKLQFRICVL